MEIRVLKYFLAVAKEESITEAAKILHVSQPNVSKQLKLLESDLGVTLFNRTNYRIKLTKEGLLLKKRAEEIIEMLEKTKNEIVTLDEVAGGDVYIGSAESESFTFLAQTANSLKKHYPHMCYHLFSGNSFDVMDRLDRGIDDFGIVFDPVDLSKYNYLTLPSDDKWGVVMRKDSPLAKKKVITISDLIDKPLILSLQATQQYLSKNDFFSWFGPRFDQITIIGTYSLIFNAFILVREGLGYAVAIESVLENSHKNELTFRPLSPKLSTNLYVIWKKSQVFSPAAEIFLTAIQTTLSHSS